MNKLTEIENLKGFFRQHNLRPKDYLGQNFLIDREALDKIVEAAELKKTDTVLEVGPGLGILTQELAQHAGQVITVEKDRRLVTLLIQNLGLSNVTIINQDILKFNIQQHIRGSYKVVANIPYYLTSKLIQNFLTAKIKPDLLVLMIQKEVAERIVAKPGELSVLGISVQFFADAEIVASVSKESFWPKPEVDSVIIRIIPRDKFSAKGGSLPAGQAGASGGPDAIDQKLFFRIVKVAFAGKRKQIKNTLKNLEALERAGIDPKSRPQDLSLDDWIRLYKKFQV